MTMNQLSGDQDMLVDIEIDLPAEIAAAHGWTPPADDAKKQKAESKTKEAAKPAVSERDLEAARRQVTETQTRLREIETTAQAEREARLRAEEQAFKNQAYALNAHLARVTADHDQFETAIKTWETQAEMAKHQMASAAENGDWKTHADMQSVLAHAQATIAQLESGKAGAKSEIEKAQRLREEAAARAEAEIRREPERKDPEPKKVTPEEYISTVRGAIGDDGAKWLEDHKEFVTDGRLNQKMRTFIEDWVDRHGESALRTQALADALDERFFPGTKKAAQDPEPSNDDEETDVSEEEEAPKRAPAAPVSRQVNSAVRSPTAVQGGNKIRLSADEQAIAVQLYPDIPAADARKRYATNKARLLKEGRL